MKIKTISTFATLAVAMLGMNLESDAGTRISYNSPQIDPLSSFELRNTSGQRVLVQDTETVQIQIRSLQDDVILNVDGEQIRINRGVVNTDGRSNRLGRPMHQELVRNLRDHNRRVAIELDIEKSDLVSLGLREEAGPCPTQTRVYEVFQFNESYTGRIYNTRDNSDLAVIEGQIPRAMKQFVSASGSCR